MIKALFEGQTRNPEAFHTMRTIFKPVYARLGISALYRKLEKMQDFGGEEEEHKEVTVSQRMAGGAV